MRKSEAIAAVKSWRAANPRIASFWKGKNMDEQQSPAVQPKSRLCIYHKNCNDGFAAALMCYMRHGSGETEYLPMDYTDKFDARYCEGKDVIIVDFSFPPRQFQVIDDCAASIVCLDHHKTMAQAYGFDPTERIEIEGHVKSGRPFLLVYDPHKSGAVLACEHFFPGTPLPLLVRYVQDRDLWQWQLPDSRAFSAALFSYPKDFETWESILHTVEENDAEFDAFVDAGDAILRAQEIRVRAMVDTGKVLWTIFQKGTIGTDAVLVEGLVINATSDQSETGEEALRLYPDAAFALVWRAIVTGNHKLHAAVSLRSRIGGFDVAEFAKQYGGGGHAPAAGFEMPMQEFMRLIRA